MGPGLTRPGEAGSAAYRALWTGPAGVFIQRRQHLSPRSILMAHKKVERMKELDRRRHRREQRLKERIHEAQAAAKNAKK